MMEQMKQAHEKCMKLGGHIYMVIFTYLLPPAHILSLLDFNFVLSFTSIINNNGFNYPRINMWPIVICIFVSSQLFLWFVSLTVG